MQKTTTAFLLLLLTVMWACNQKLSVPPVSATATNTYTPGRFVWHDLITGDVDVAARFYGSVFGWTFAKIGSGKTAYTVVSNNGKAIGGILPIPANSNISSGEWIGSLSVTNSVADACATTVSSGGKVMKSETAIPGRGTVALVSDPQGAVLAYIKATGGDPTPALGGTNDWLGMELWSNDMAGSQKFYETLAQYTTENVNTMQVPYKMLSRDGKLCAGLMENPVKNVRTHWMPYIRVNDVAAVTAKIKTAGGKLIMEPSATVRNGTVAVALDPTGAPFVIQVYNPK